MKPRELVMFALLLGIVAGGITDEAPVAENQGGGNVIITEMADNRKELQPILLEASRFLDRGEWA